VGGRGPEKPKLLVVLEFAPRNESIAPKRVKIIRDQLIEMGVDLKQVRWTGALRCHSAMRHAGETIEEQKTAIEINRIVKGCRDHLLAEIKECDPKVVLLVGNVALKTAFSRKSGMDKYKGSIFQEDDRTYLVTKDPLNIPKKSRAEDEFLASLKKVKACLTGKLEGDGKYMMPKTTEELQAARKILLAQDILTFDFEIAMNLSKGVRETDKLLGCGFSWEAGKAIYIPLDHKDSPFNGTQEAHDVVKEVLAAKGIGKIAHNGYFDCHAAKVFYKELPANFMFDTMLAHHLLDPTTGTHGLKYLAGMHTDLGGYEEKISAILDKLPKADRNYGVLPLDMIAKYCCIDADVTFRLYGRFQHELKEMNLTEFFEKITMPTIMTLIDMRIRGFNLDLGKLDMLIDLYEKEVVSTLKEVLACPKVQETNAELNVNSPKQIAKLLFEVYKLPVLKKTASGAPAADMATLLRAASTIKDEGEVSTFINAYLTHKKAKKTLATYLISMREKAHKTEDGIRIYTDYRPLTETGRLMSSSPNLQNLPADHDKKHKVKDIFTAPEGYQFMEMDFSQIELRNLANTTRDEQLVGAYLNGEDLHTKTAQLLFQRDEVTSGERKLGKTINFASVYGAGPWRLAETITTGNLLDGPETLAMVMDTLSLDQKQAKTKISRNLNAALADVGEVLLDRFFSSYPAVASWQTKIESYVAKHEHLRTPFGRIRYIETRTKRGAKYTAQWQNIAKNTPIQSVSSDCLLLSLVACNELLKARGAKTQVVGTVHDSILFYIHEDEMDLIPIIKKEMEVAPTRFMPDFFVVPLVADIQIGSSWGKIEPLELDNTA